MAARKRTWTPEIVRDRIRVGMLTNRLAGHVLGRIEMTASQVRAAEVLLRKCVPDLASTELTGDPENPVHVERAVRFVE